MEIKVFGIGFPKTGTKTLKRVLETLGYTVGNYRLDILEPLKSGEYEKLVPIIDNYDALQDTPWFLLYQFLDKTYPNSKFILTLRDRDNWMASMNNYFVGKHDESSNRMFDFIFGYGLPRDNNAAYLSRYDKHIKDVKEYFKGRPEDLLIVDWEKGHGWEEICEFLKKPKPAVLFPHANKGNYVKRGKVFIPFHLKKSIYSLMKYFIWGRVGRSVNLELRDLRLTNFSFCHDGEDLVLFSLTRYFDRNTNVYVDLGTDNPVKESKTYLMYKRGYKGLNIVNKRASLIEFERYRSEDENILSNVVSDINNDPQETISRILEKSPIIKNKSVLLLNVSSEEIDINNLMAGFDFERSTPLFIRLPIASIQRESHLFLAKHNYVEWCRNLNSTIYKQNV